MTKIVIIGAGLAGLSAALHLEQAGFAPLIIERSERIGGRVKSDAQDGFIFDRGFQVLLDSYPEFQALGAELELAPFAAGARCRVKDSWQTYSNPLSSWSFAHFSDYLKLSRVLISSAPDTSTEEWIRQLGISEECHECFLRPFLGGVFLETALKTHASRFKELLGYFFRGRATLPRRGMQALPDFLADQLKQTQIRCGCGVEQLEPGRLRLSGQEELLCDELIVTCAQHDAQALLPKLPKRASKSVTCVYFSIPRNKVEAEAILYLDAAAERPALNLSFNSAVQPSYAPADMHLMAATVVDPTWQKDPQLVEKVRSQLEELFACQGWQHLRSDVIEHALPAQEQMPGPRESDGITWASEVVCGASINDALAAGRKAAHSISVRSAAKALMN